jgi:hypothetical protein
VEVLQSHSGVYLYQPSESERRSNRINSRSPLEVLFTPLTGEEGGSIDGPAVCRSSRVIGDRNGLLCVAGATVTCRMGEVTRGTGADLVGEAEFTCTRLTASLTDILRRSQFVDADEGPAFSVSRKMAGEK